MSGIPSDHWMQFHHDNALYSADHGRASPTVFGGATTSVNQKHTTMSMSPESGRVSKPVRKRSRASRRTPTTLLNTDPTNFRAMVQQFTGGPSFGSGPVFTNPTAFGLGIGGNRDQAHMMGPGYQIQYQVQPQQYEEQNRDGYSYPGLGQDPIIQRMLMSDKSNASGMGIAAGRGGGEGGSNENTQYSF